jgi:peptidoglycan L-alanyl-D-glutamate endopeptidase CwlK
MPSFGNRSLDCLETVHPDIQLVLHEAIKHYDFSVIEGHRTEEKQNEYFASGASQVKYPHSKHNMYPSMAVDIVPYPIDWENTHRFKELADIIKKACETVDVTDLHWGYDLWKWDMPHWELRR